MLETEEWKTVALAFLSESLLFNLGTGSRGVPSQIC